MRRSKQPTPLLSLVPLLIEVTVLMIGQRGPVRAPAGAVAEIDVTLFNHVALCTSAEDTAVVESYPLECPKVLE